MNTTVSLNVNVTVLPAGLSYSIGGDGTMNLPWYGDCMSFESGTETGSGAISLSGDSALPNCICNIQSHVMWNININGWNVSSDVGVTENPVFVTFSNPLSDWSYSATNVKPTPLASNSITDKRLELATSICSGVSDVFVAAATVQKALPTIVPNWYDADHPPNPPAGSTDAVPHTTEQIWGLARGENGLYGACNQYACFEELMLRQLGIRATFEEILPTAYTYTPGQVVVGTALAGGGDFTIPNPTRNEQLTLKFSFGGHMNNWEGGVLVQDQNTGQSAWPAEFFSEGRHWKDQVIGVANTARDQQGNNVTVSPEYDAILHLAWHYYSNASDFQQYFSCTQVWEPAVANSPFPGPYPNTKP